MGLIFQLIAIILLSLFGALGLLQAAQASIGIAFVLYMLPVLAAAVGAPMLAYRIYGLQTALYSLERDGIRLRWGLRSEDVPVDEIQWIHPAADLTSPLPLPPIRIPGAILGKRSLPGVGEIEYMAAGKRDMLYIATDQGGFVISPAEPERFLEVYQRFTEMGSLTPLRSRSIYPSFLIHQVWSSWSARLLLVVCALLSLGLLAWVIQFIPDKTGVHMGFHPDGSPGDLVPAARLLLLPVLNFFFLVIGVSLGLFFYRREDSRMVSYLLWTANAISTLFFLMAVFFIQRSG
jgi:hypothetical protein